MDTFNNIMIVLGLFISIPFGIFFIIEIIQDELAVQIYQKMLKPLDNAKSGN